MTELDELERDLEEATSTWFNPALHKKLKRLIVLARNGQPCAGAVQSAGAGQVFDVRESDVRRAYTLPPSTTGDGFP